MDILEWLGLEIAGHWVALASGSIAVTVVVAAQKYWDTWAAPLRFGITSGGIIFICVLLATLLPAQFDRQISELERLTDEQTMQFERQAKVLTRLSDEAQRQTEILKQLAGGQSETLDSLAKAMPTRPYFTMTDAHIYKVSSGQFYLTISMQNNTIPTENLTSQLMVIKEDLDPRSWPLHSKTARSANPVGPGATYSHHWGPVRVPPNARPAFVVFQVQYTDALSGEVFLQDLFLVFRGASENGTFIQQLFNATNDQKVKMQIYMERRGISQL